MKLTLDPYLFRGVPLLRVPLLKLPALVAELGYEWIELSPREDFTPFFNHLRFNHLRVDTTGAEFRKALRHLGTWATPPTFQTP
jgi:myo-inositol catabolism protein IolH